MLGNFVDDRFDLEYEAPQNCFHDTTQLDPSQTIFSRMISIDDSRFFMIHQLKDFSLLFQECSASVGIFVDIECKNITLNRNLSSKITSFAAGIYGGLPTVVMVEEKQRDTYHLFSEFGF